MINALLLSVAIDGGWVDITYDECVALPSGSSEEAVQELRSCVENQLEIRASASGEVYVLASNNDTGSFDEEIVDSFVSACIESFLERTRTEDINLGFSLSHVNSNKSFLLLSIYFNESNSGSRCYGEIRTMEYVLKDFGGQFPR